MDYSSFIRKCLRDNSDQGLKRTQNKDLNFTKLDKRSLDNNNTNKGTTNLENKKTNKTNTKTNKNKNA